MYYSDRRKKIVIAIVVIVLILIIGAGFAYAYFATDLFKSNQILFYKYLGQTVENFNYANNTQSLEFEKLKNEMPYTSKATLKYAVDGENTDDTSKILSDMKLDVLSKVNIPEEKSYTKANLTFKDQNLFSLEYANTGNLYALKSDEIVTAYLGIRNENLKVLAQKYGIEDTSMIPNEIKPIDYKMLLELSEEEKNHIRETYLSVLLNNTNKENYKKEKDLPVNKEGINYIVDAYRLDLNSDEIKNIKLQLLDTLKQDSITLNFITTKAKLLGLDENYTQVNNLVNLIQEKIDNINNEINNIEDSISIIIYIDNNQVLLTEIILKNEVKYTVYSDTIDNVTKSYILYENLNLDVEYNKIEIKLNETRNDNQTIYDLIVNLNDETNIKTYITNSYNVNLDEYNTNCEIEINQKNEEIESKSIIDYAQSVKVEEELNDIVELNNTNCAILNNYTTEQLQSFTQSVIGRIVYVFGEKMQIINSNNSTTNNNVIPENTI